ncbi:hypothetical protein GN244_ATG20952 [Phytophthora infestans]|uniref:Uncharacterized protein n=1 Tax=Phytophthora infestans TaxID=4787 RepID=A0A833WBV6_PHYIN|nr:hypothetical protein GN244_ATG20952 [Phytophthora infestans]
MKGHPQWREQTDDAGGGASQKRSGGDRDKTNDGECHDESADASKWKSAGRAPRTNQSNGRVMTSYMDQKKPRYMKGDASNLPMLRQHHPVTTTEVESEEKCNERGHVNHGEHGERRDDRRGQRETVRRRRRRSISTGRQQQL